MGFLIEYSGKNYTIKEFIGLDQKRLPPWAQAAQAFLKQWQNGDETFLQQTSGSTGKPKEISMTRFQMEVSAMNTIEALSIPEGANVLHCIDSAYVGGKMLWVRAIIGQWHVHLIEPKGTIAPELLWSAYDFSAMVPIQVANALKNPSRDSILDRFKQVIIGGAAVNDDLIRGLQPCKAICYSTFGMTETISHIALRALNGPNKREEFKVIGDNKIKLTPLGCLMVKGKVTHEQWITTNDLVKITENGFQWLGRYDLVVNTGGVKVGIEEAEKLLKKHTDIEDPIFVLWKRPHAQLGEQLIGITDSKQFITHLREQYEEIQQQLPRYYFPKQWFLTGEIKYTPNGKVDRARTAEQLVESFTF
jgi:O-succinylbenzoic acid--CoA ligase